MPLFLPISATSTFPVRRLILSLVLLIAAGCSAGAAASPDPATDAAPVSSQLPSPSPTDYPDPILASVDPADLVADPPARPFDRIVVNPTPPQRVPNASRSFWVSDPATGKLREVTARLRVQTEHAAMWVEEWVWHDVRKLEEAALLFDDVIYPAVRSAFGSEWTPGVDNDPHIHILHADLGQRVLGYTSSAAELPGAVY
ncbi:MAG: hypothetical protein E3J64_05240, partial [Anaerolineales bacterium]